MVPGKERLQQEVERKNKEKEQKRIEAAIRAEELEVERERINFEREKAAAEQRRQEQSEQFLSESPKPIAHASKPDAASLSGFILLCTIVFCCGCPVLLGVGRGPSGSSSSPSYDISPKVDHESNRISDRHRQRLLDSLDSLSDDEAVEVFVRFYNGSSGNKKQEIYDGVVSRASSGVPLYKSILSRISRP